jgi:hypothetical protein
MTNEREMTFNDISAVKHSKHRKRILLSTKNTIAIDSVSFNYVIEDISIFIQIRKHEAFQFIAVQQ